MRVLVVGAGKTGATVIRQLRKNPAFTVLTLDPRKDPYALREGLVESIDVREPLTPLTIDEIFANVEPDLVLLASASEDMGLGEAGGIDVLAKTLRDELKSLAKVPVIEIARDSG